MLFRTNRTPPDEDAPDPFEPFFRMFGALLVIIGFLWLKDDGRALAQIGKVAIALSGVFFGYHRRLWQKPRLSEAWGLMTRRQKINYAAIGLLAIAGIQLARPATCGMGMAKVVIFFTGVLALFYGGLMIVGRKLPEKETPEDTDINVEDNNPDEEKPLE